jgi:uncharacterized membrane protein YqgA involved in biofilm formation
VAKYLVGRGTLLNTATVAVGAGIGLAAGSIIPEAYKDIVMGGLGLITFGLGTKLFLQSKNIVIVAASIVFGGILGMFLGIHSGIEAFAEWAKHTFGGEGSSTFAEAVITTSVLFCVGPMTLLGCLQDALEDKIELLSIKSTMDGFCAIFFAAALGPGVLVTAGVVLVAQGILTIAATPLKKLVSNEATIAEASASGGVILMGIGVGLLGETGFLQVDRSILPVANFIPALVLAPAIAALMNRKSRGIPEPTPVPK